MRVIGLLSNLEHHRIAALVSDISNWLSERGVALLHDDQMSCDSIGPMACCTREEMVKRADCLIVLGGDGSLLHSARLAAPVGVPVFGVNLGRLGFLTEVDIPHIHMALDQLLNGSYTIEERMMLQAEVFRNGQTAKSLVALNDAVITKGAFARLIVLDTFVDGHHFNTYHADGVIVSTPTGSTAYSLSAGGPLVMPDLELMVVTPICPHALWARPLVISGTSAVEVTLLSKQGEVMLTIDGQHGTGLQYGDIVRVKKSGYQARFIKLNNRTFFHILREKLKEGDGKNVV